MNRVEKIIWVLLILCIFMSVEARQKTIINDIKKLDDKVTTYLYVSNITVSGGCEDNSCITYGGNCEDPVNSYVIVDGINVREGCKNE